MAHAIVLTIVMSITAQVEPVTTAVNTTEASWLRVGSYLKAAQRSRVTDDRVGAYASVGEGLLVGALTTGVLLALRDVPNGFTTPNTIIVVDGFITAALFLGGGIAGLVSTYGSDEIGQLYATLDASGTGDHTEALNSIRKTITERGESARKRRVIGSVLAISIGGLITALGVATTIMGVVGHEPSNAYVVPAMSYGIGLSALVSGIAGLTVGKSSEERLSSMLHEDATGSPAPTAGLTIAPALGASLNSVSLGLSGTF